VPKYFLSIMQLFLEEQPPALWDRATAALLL